MFNLLSLFIIKTILILINGRIFNEKNKVFSQNILYLITIFQFKITWLTIAETTGSGNNQENPRLISMPATGIFKEFRK